MEHTHMTHLIDSEHTLMTSALARNFRAHFHIHIHFHFNFGFCVPARVQQFRILVGGVIIISSWRGGFKFMWPIKHRHPGWQKVRAIANEKGGTFVGHPFKIQSHFYEPTET